MHRAEAATRRMGDECPGFYKILCPQFFCEFLWVLRLCVLLRFEIRHFLSKFVWIVDVLFVVCEIRNAQDTNCVQSIHSSVCIMQIIIICKKK